MTTLRGLDQRSHPRLRTQLKVRLAAIEPDRDPATGALHFPSDEADSIDVSLGGALVSSSAGLTPGRRLLVEIDLPDAGTIRALGRVAWRKKRIGSTAPTGSDPRSGIGIEFLGGPPEQLRSLERFLTRRAELRR